MRSHRKKVIAVTILLSFLSSASIIHYGFPLIVDADRAVWAMLERQYEQAVNAVADSAGFETIRRYEQHEAEAYLRDVVCPKYHLDCELALAIMRVESRGKQYAKSGVGAIGYMQIMPEHVKFCGLENSIQLYEMTNNLDCFARVLSDQLTLREDIIDALRGYNCSPAGVQSNNPKCWKYARDVLNTMFQNSMGIKIAQASPKKKKARA